MNYSPTIIGNNRSNSERKIITEAHIQANNETKIFEVLKLTGTVRVVDQVAEITEATAITNLTNVYASLWDGTVSVNLTSDGIVLSGAPVGTMFTKDQLSSQPYGYSMADQGRVLETLSDRNAGRPFTVTQKNGVDTFIRLHVTTTTVLDFKIRVRFTWEPIDGGNLVLNI